MFPFTFSSGESGSLSSTVNPEILKTHGFTLSIEDEPPTPNFYLIYSIIRATDNDMTKIKDYYKMPALWVLAILERLKHEEYDNANKH